MNTFYRPVTLTDLNKGHVYYHFKDEEIYLQKVASYIHDGLKQNDQILLIESMKFSGKVSHYIENHFSEEEQNSIRLVNNFDYYAGSSKFNIASILAYFDRDAKSLSDKNVRLRTWAHVEWMSGTSDAALLKSFETSSDEFILNENILSVCAYRDASLTDDANAALEQSHKYVMTDDQFQLSQNYIKLEKTAQCDGC
ncbi:MEDS domain-containing protein [Metabacillus indicus]|uniref:MEDS domain-containing protein n=1 Tax=Metabacillus indicus TaxID=246786 RepID=UPI002A06F8DA|nr:MEDS domain-containing protein [Metabacillus indicus]MDX8290437.1 MEDS domain-containing protein [Metabacillus indicus]